MAMADMDIFTHHSAPEHRASTLSSARPSWLVVDGNWAEADIQSWVRAAKDNGCSVAFEPVSTAKAARLFARGGDAPLGVYPRAGIDVAAPNNFELLAMWDAARENGYLEDAAWFGVVDAFGLRGARERFVYVTDREVTDAGIPQQSMQLLPYIPTIVTKLGSKGVLLTSILGKGDPRLRDAESQQYIVARNDGGDGDVGGVYMRMFRPAEEVKDVVSVNGVGDTFLGVLIAGLARGGRVDGLVDVAQEAAVMTLRSREAVSPELGRLEGRLAEAVRRG